MKLKLWIKISVLAAISVVALLFGLLIYRGASVSGSKPGESYSYNISRSSDYKVYLVDNSHYDVPYLSPKENPDIKQYASSLIDYIDVDFNYNYSQSAIKNFYTSYSVKAIITGQYENSKNTSSGELWKKNYTLLNDTDMTSENTSTYGIKQNIKLNYGSYNAEVSQYRATTHLAVDAELKVVMQINSYSVPFDSPDFDRSKPASTDEIALSIPLTTSATKVDEQYESRTSGTITPEREVSTNGVMIVSGIIGVIISGTALVILIKIFFRDERSRYERKLDKIMKDYSDIIAEVDGGKITEKEFIDIKSFEDLVDIEEELKSPILFYEVSAGKEAWFIIRSDSIYRYILKSKKDSL